MSRKSATTKRRYRHLYLLEWFLPYLIRSQQENFEHEFLLVFVTHAQKQCVLRLERSALPQQKRSFLQKLAQTSSGFPPALDMVRISSSSEQLTSGMDRGPSIPVLRLPFLTYAPFALRELCLILSFFPAFSPQYKLRQEQCYWFCDVVVSTVREACNGVSIVKEEGFKRAGKFGKFSAQLSAPTRKLFVDAYSLIRTLGQSSQLGMLPSVTPAQEDVDMLVSMLGVSSSEAITRAVMALTRLARQSPEHRRMVAEAGIATKLVSIIDSASPLLKVHILAALDAVVNESADINVLTHFLSLSLSSNDVVTYKKAVSMLGIIASAEGGNRAFVALLSGVSLKLHPRFQRIALKEIMSCLNRNPQLVTDNALISLFDLFLPAVPTQTRTGAIVSLMRLAEQSLEHNRVTRMTPPSPESGKVSKVVFKKLTNLLTDNNATIRAAASEGLTKLASHSEFLPIRQLGVADARFKLNCMLGLRIPSGSSFSYSRTRSAMSGLSVKIQ